MNLCFILGKIINDVDLKFILRGKHKSIVLLKLQLENNSVIEVRAYDEIADYCYKYFNKGEIVFAEGKLNTNMYIVLSRIEKT